MKEKRMTTITLKKMNRDKVYQYIYQQKETSKLQIFQDLQMGLSTVSQNLNDYTDCRRFPYLDRSWNFKRYVSHCRC